MKASFFKRLGAFLVDMLILSLISDLLFMGFSNAKYEKITKDLENLTEEFDEKMENEENITYEELTDYLKQIADYTYEANKAAAPITIATPIITIGYFVVFAYLNKGQTLGKKILHLRIKEEKKDPSLKAMIIRSLFIVNIFSGLLNIILLYTLSGYKYYLVLLSVTGIEEIFIFITALFVLYRKDKRGLHDLMAKTTVIEERG